MQQRVKYINSKSHIKIDILAEVYSTYDCFCKSRSKATMTLHTPMEVLCPNNTSMCTPKQSVRSNKCPVSESVTITKVQQLQQWSLKILNNSRYISVLQSYMQIRYIILTHRCNSYLIENNYYFIPELRCINENEQV